MFWIKIQHVKMSDRLRWVNKDGSVISDKSHAKTDLFERVFVFIAIGI